jgi:hypothetical protein
MSGFSKAASHDFLGRSALGKASSTIRMQRAAIIISPATVAKFASLAAIHFKVSSMGPVLFLGFTIAKKHQ